MAVPMRIFRDTRLFRRPDTFVKRSVFSFFLVLFLSFIILVPLSAASAKEPIEYQVKTAFIYNFIAFTQWPENAAEDITLCVYGEGDFGDEIDKLQGKSVNNHNIRVERIYNSEDLEYCQVIFFSKSVGNNLSGILNNLQSKSVLTLADSPDAISQGVVINMSLVNGKIVFEINLRNARRSGINISSKLLQLAVHVYQ